MFYFLEDNGELDCLSDIDLFSLHYVFVPNIKTNILKKIVNVIDINLKDVEKSTSLRLLPEL